MHGQLGCWEWAVWLVFLCESDGWSLCSPKLTQLAFSGNINLPRLLPFLGKSQLQVLSIVVSGLLLAGHCVMAIFVKEKVLLKSTAVDG